MEILFDEEGLIILPETDFEESYLVNLETPKLVVLKHNDIGPDQVRITGLKIKHVNNVNRCSGVSSHCGTRIELDPDHPDLTAELKNER